MQAYQPDWVTKTLDALVSAAYFALFIAAPLVLAAGLAARLLPLDDHWTWEMNVPAAIRDSPAMVQTSWGPARLEVKNVTGTLQMPIRRLPWPLITIAWLHAAAAFALMLVSLHQLRRVFQRLRAGAPFDAANAQRLRWLGLALLGLALLNGIAELGTSLALRPGLPPASITVPVALRIDTSLVFAALVLMALARIFRRGSDLEDDQSLVV